MPDDYSNADVNYSVLSTTGLGELYTVTETSKGYSFKAVTDGQKIGNYEFTMDGAVADSDGATDTNHITTIDTKQIADDAIVFVYTPDNDISGGGVKDAKTITGKQLKTLNAAAANGNISTTAIGYFTTKVDNLDRVSVAAVSVYTQGPLPGVSATYNNYAMLVSDAYTVVDSDYITYDIWTGSEIVTVKEQNTLTPGTYKTFDVIEYDEIDSEGVINDVRVLTEAVADGNGNTTAGQIEIGSVYSVDGSKMWISDSKYVELNNDTVYMYYDSSAEKAADMGKTSGTLIKSDPVGGVLVPNVKYVADGSGVIFVLVDVKNKIVDDEARAACGITATDVGTNFDGVAGATATFSSTTDIMLGETLTLTITTGTTGLSAGTLTLTNAVFAENGLSTLTVPAQAPNSTAKYSIVADSTSSAISITGTAATADATNQAAANAAAASLVTALKASTSDDGAGTAADPILVDSDEFAPGNLGASAADKVIVSKVVIPADAGGVTYTMAAVGDDVVSSADVAVAATTAARESDGKLSITDYTDSTTNYSNDSKVGIKITATVSGKTADVYVLVTVTDAAA